MSTRNVAFYVFSLLGLSILPEAKALPPAKPTDGSVRFTRVSLTQQAETYHSYHLRWKDNAPDADGTEIQLRFANAGAFYFLTNGSPTPISERDAESYREAIISVGSPPPGTICQFQVVTWKFNGSKTESSSLLIQTRVTSAPVPTLPLTNNTFLAPTNLTAQIRDGDDGRVNISWEDKSDIEAFHQLFVGEVITSDVNGTPISTVPNYNHVGFIPFGKTSEILSNEVYLPFGGIAQQSPNLIPGKTYRFGLRATKIGGADLPTKSFPTVANVPAIPLTSDNVTQVMVSGNFTMPALKGPANLTGSVTGENTILLNWTDNSNNETGYEIQYRIITGGAPPEFVKFADASKNASSYSVNMGQLATAEFRVCAVYKYTPPSPSGASEIAIRSAFTPSTVQLSTTSFLPPTDLTAVTSASGISNTVDLTWQDNSNSEVGFDVFCRPTESSEVYKRCVSVPSNITNISVQSFTASKGSSNEPIFTPLAIGSSYDFVVRAIGSNEAISSPDSNVAVAIPQQGFTSDMYAPITQGVFFTHTAMTSNEGTRTAITATGLPAGLGIVSSTGVISGTPTQSGRFPVTLTATFSPGPTAVSTLMLLVKSTETLPAVAATIPNVTIRINEPLRIPLIDKFTDPDTETAVRWETNKGNVDFLLYPSLAPLAVANFMAYVNAGDYTNILVHRHVPNFVLQAGGFRADSTLSSVASRPSPLNEPGISNTQWTIAAAKRGSRDSTANTIIKTAYETANPLLPKLTDDDFRYAGEPNSATTDIFINLDDNAANLDKQNGGFTVFGRVAKTSQPVVAAITALPIGNYGFSPLNSIPINAASVPAALNLNQVVKVNRAYPISTLRYSTDNVSAQIASTSIENNELLLTGKAAGTRLVTLTATDFDNKTVSQTFTITVNDSYQPPSITTQPSSQAVTAGSVARLSVTALGTNINYKWQKNGVEITPTETNSTLSIADFQADDVGDYEVIISNANSTLTSRQAVLTIRSPAIITGSLISRIVEVGKSLEIEANITGSPEPSCVWKRGSTTINGQTNRKLFIASAKLTDAGLYSVSASNTAGSSAPGAGGVATVIVIDKTTQYQNVKATTLVKLIAPVAGVGLTYQWKRGGVDIGSGEPGFSGQQDATLIISSVTTGNIGDYTCVITAPAGLGSAETGIIRLSVPTQKPTLATFMLPNAFVGLPYRYQIELAAGSSQSGAPGKFSVSGLPTGLSCDVNTGIIAGTPRATGIFSVKATVSNAVGTVISTASTLKVSPLEAATSGSYVASISPSQPLNFNLGGRLDVTLTDDSAFTATLQLGGETLRSAGALNLTLINNTLTYASVVSFPRPNRKTVQATLILQPSSTFLQGSISDGTSTATISGYRHAWSSQFRSGPPPFIGMPFAFAVGSFRGSVTFNVALEAEVERLGQTDTPEGSGYLALTVTNGGTATAAGRLSDGTPITASTLISSSAEMYLFQALNLGTSSLGGFMELSTVNYSQLSSNLRWMKGRQPLAERVYQPGFNPTLLSAYGARYLAPTDKNVLKISDIEKNVLMKFSRGGLTPADPSLSIKLRQTGGVVYPAANPSKVSLILSPNTGLINGSFELDGAEKRKATYQGLIIPRNLDNPSGNGVILKPASGVGYFLLPGLTPTVATSAIKSGMVSMNGILITTQPSSQNVLTGANVTFSVDAIVIADLSALTYQWQKNGVPLSDGTGVAGAATKTLTLETVDNADAADYTCLIKSGTEVQAITKVATLALVISDVVASRTPNTIPLPAPTSVTFSVTAKGSGTLIYTWLKNGLVIPGAKTSTLTINPTKGSDDGVYVARVSSKTTPAGVVSNLVNLNMTAISNIQASAMGLTAPFEVLAKTRVTLNVTAVGTALKYQWRKNGVPISKATGASYSFTAGTVAEIGNYDVLVSNPLSVTGTASNVIPISVITPVLNPLITRTTPSTAAVAVNSSVTLSAAAAGGGLLYQWKKDGQNISGKTSQTYTFTTDATAGSPVYTVEVSNLATAVPVLSSPLTVSVQEAITSVVISRTDPVGATVPPLTSVTLTAVANGSNLTYQWYNGNVLIPSANAAIYNFISGSVASTNNYKVVVSNGLLPNGFTSNMLPVEVAPAP